MVRITIAKLRAIYIVCILIAISFDLYCAIDLIRVPWLFLTFLHANNFLVCSTRPRSLDQSRPNLSLFSDEASSPTASSLFLLARPAPFRLVSPAAHSQNHFPSRHAPAQLGIFQWDSLLIATIVHLILSLLVGLLYGAMLPMYPRRPILLGGLIAPILWSGLVHSTIDLIAPPLNQRINWRWFVLSQVGFGILAGITVSRQVRIRTLQHFPFALRAGFEAPGAIDEKDAGKAR